MEKKKIRLWNRDFFLSLFINWGKFLIMVVLGIFMTVYIDLSFFSLVNETLPVFIKLQLWYADVSLIAVPPCLYLQMEINLHISVMIYLLLQLD